MEYIYYEDENSCYIIIGCVEKVLFYVLLRLLIEIRFIKIIHFEMI